MTTSGPWFVNRYAYPDESATARMLGDLCESLAAAGFAPLTLASDQRLDDPGAALPADETTATGRVVRVAGTRRGRRRLAGRMLDYLSFVRGARARLRNASSAPRVVVTMTDPPLLGTLLRRAIARCGAAHVEWLQDLYPEIAEAAGVIRPGGWLARWLKARRAASWRRAAAVVVVGEDMRERVVAAGAARERVHVIANWADTATIAPIEPASNPLRHEWGLDRHFVVGYSGNFGRVHAFDGLLAAAEHLRVRDDVAFVLVGEGAQAAALRTRVAARGLGQVQFRPYQPRQRLAQSLGVPDLHVVALAPTFEGLVVPSKLYGALAAGRPVLFLGDAEGEVARFVRRHHCGLTVDPHDGAAIAAAIASLAADRAYCAAMGVRARIAALAEGSRDAAVAKWAALLESLGVRGAGRTAPGAGTDAASGRQGPREMHERKDGA
jgi:glycosyltransferase involved in cell wall biosynthesis